MATIAQIKALFESYISKDDERFITYGLQIAAHEAKLGHGKIAEELRRLIDIARKKGTLPNLAILFRSFSHRVSLHGFYLLPIQIPVFQR